MKKFTPPEGQLTIEQLAPVFAYCRLLSRLVSPADAQRHYGLRHDGAVSDFLRDLSVAITNGETLSTNDEFYGSVYTRICEDVAALEN
jgi:hypothetical protein